MDDSAMTQRTADRVADAVLLAGALGIAYFVARTPPLRRLASRLIVLAATGSLPAWIGREVQHAWSESGRQTL
jgi:uncharacterized protein (DUF2236 family)